MSDAGEELLGEISVTSHLRFGSENLRLLFTNRRLVVDHGGKRGAGAVAGTGILGKLSSGLEDLFKSGGESVSRRRVQKMTPAQVLHAHKDNFAMRYDEVVNVTVEQTFPQNTITILTGDDKFVVFSRTRFDTIVELFSKTLGDKVTARRFLKQGSHL